MKRAKVLVPLVFLTFFVIALAGDAYGGQSDILLMGDHSGGTVHGGHQSRQSSVSGRRDLFVKPLTASRFCPYGGVYGGGPSIGLQVVSLGNGQGGIFLNLGDSLYFITALVYYNPYSWRNTYYYNIAKIGNPNSFSDGTIVVIPGISDKNLYNVVETRRSSYGPYGNAPRGSKVTWSATLFTSVSGMTITPGFNWSKPIRATPFDKVSSHSSSSSSSSGHTHHAPAVSSGAFNVTSPIQTGTITSNFGHRTLRGKHSDHKGIDIGAPKGTPITATGDGTVVASGWGNGYGNYVKVQHPDGTQTIYAHCNTLDVRKGETVKAGQKIATVNSTGNSTGNHLHYEIKVNGTSVDPRNYFDFPDKGQQVHDNITPKG